MGRLLVSVLAGVLVIMGAWWGWSRPARVNSALTQVAGWLPGDSAPEATSAAGADAPGDADSSSCPLPKPTTAEGMNTLMSRLDSEPTLLGGDHGGSVRLKDGRHMFVFGDTLREPATDSPFMVRNSVLVTNGGCPEPMHPPGGGAVIPNEGEIGHWPMSLRAVPHSGGTTVQVITSKVRSLGGHDEFETIGSGLATFEVASGEAPRLVSHTPLGPTTNDPSVPTWGAAMWEDDGWIHVFGTASNETKTTSGWSLHVARTRPETLADPTSWEYWDGSTWVEGDRSAAAGPESQLIPADHGVSHVLSVFQRNGSWYALSKEGDVHGDTLAVWKAPSVTGPYTKHQIMPLTNDDGIRRYTPLAHPDFETSSGQLLISWSESPTSPEGYVSDPGAYRPHFEEIQLP